MKRILFIACVFCFLIHESYAQSTRIIGPIEKKMTDSLCGCVSALDISSINTKAEATKAYTGCVGKYLGLLKDFADERKVDFGDKIGMEKLGIDLAINLITRDCNGFKQLALTMAGNSKSGNEMISGAAIGTFKRIENKGFNYLIITEGGQERSFLWLRQFNGSEKFMNGNTNYAGRKIKISYQELEVYLPQAKGYYKVKEITAIDFI